MAVVTSSWVLDSLLLIVSLLYLLYRHLTSTHGYFRDRGILYLQPYSLLSSFLVPPKSQIEQSQFLYNSFPGEKFFGYFLLKEPVLIVKDPELIQRILVKDFVHFQDRGGIKGISGDLVTLNLFSQKGKTWRSLRYKLSPTFTSGKLKFMFDQMTNSGDHALDFVEESNGVALDAKQLSRGFVIEVIASTAFGLDFSKKNTQTDEFLKKSSSVTKPGFYTIIVFVLGLVVPKLIKYFNISILSSDVEKYFLNLTKATKEYRKENNIKRDDYFQLLLTLQESEESGKSLISSSTNDYSKEDALIDQMGYAPQNQQEKEVKLMTDTCITAQTLIFLTGGSDSVGTTLMFALYHIAKDPVIHRRLTKEVDSTLAVHGVWSYAAIKEMTYLDMILQETLRLYPPSPVVMRECTVPYHIPDTNIVLEKGVNINIPVKGLHMDPNAYANPELFKPERFLHNNYKPNSSYIPFGDGPRICIAMRFAILEMKVCLAKVVSQYTMEVDKKTQEPFTFDTQSFAPSPVGGIWLNFHKRNGKVD